MECKIKTSNQLILIRVDPYFKNSFQIIRLEIQRINIKKINKMKILTNQILIKNHDFKIKINIKMTLIN